MLEREGKLPWGAPLALYQQAGLIEVPTVPALLETVRVLATQPVLQGPRVAVLTNSRSPGTLAAAALTVAAPSRAGWPAPRFPECAAAKPGRILGTSSLAQPVAAGTRSTGPARGSVPATTTGE